MEKKYYEHTWISSSDTRTINTVDEYDGGENLIFYCTQLNESQYPKQSERKKIQDNWIDFFHENPKKLKRVMYPARMNQKLLDAICMQENLEELWIKWGVYPNIESITNLKKLKHLYLCAGASLVDITPIGKLVNLQTLILSTVGVNNYQIIGELKQLQRLEFHSGMDNLIKIDSLDFMENITSLKKFSTTGFRLESHDYSPILKQNHLEYLSVNMPAYDHKKWNSRFAEQFPNIAYNAHLRYK